MPSAVAAARRLKGSAVAIGFWLRLPPDYKLHVMVAFVAVRSIGVLGMLCVEGALGIRGEFQDTFLESRKRGRRPLAISKRENVLLT